MNIKKIQVNISEKYDIHKKSVGGVVSAGAFVASSLGRPVSAVVSLCMFSWQELGIHGGGARTIHKDPFKRNVVWL